MRVLNNISFDVRQGEIRSIIGPNGAGKSSMLNVINGVYHPQQGTITYRGETRRQMVHQRREQGIARTFQNIALFKGMSTLDNIMTGRNLKIKSNMLRRRCYWGKAQREEIEHRKKVEEIIDFLEIQAIRKTPVGKLPYGMQKRVELGRALAAEPDLLLLDEPMAGMNVEEKEDMCRFVLDINDEFGTTIVLIEHDMGVVMDLSDRVVVLDYGMQLADGPPDEVRNNQAVIDAYLGVPYEQATTDVIFDRNRAQRPHGRRHVLPGGSGLRADLQSLRRVQFCPGRDVSVRRSDPGRIDGEIRHADRLAIIRTIVVMVAVAWLIEWWCYGTW